MNRLQGLIGMGCGLALGASACGGDKKPAATATQAVPTSTTIVTSADLERRVDVSPSVSVSTEIMSICKLPLGNVSAAPKFAFDESDLALADYQMLELIGQCMSTGPLAGRSLQLTGRADARGTNEYNMALGARRANTVGSYLEQFGVDRTRLRETSRGELDALGPVRGDPAARQVDRRVDITLVK